MFSGNTALLVASPTLQDYLVDKTTGLPLAAGVVTFYQDAQRQTLKNVYTQQGTPGAYTYTALPNPLTLSAVGTIQDNNGNDVIPFFYPFDETDQSKSQTYYVTVYSSAGLLQFTRQNFPLPKPQTSSLTNPLLSNYLTNNLFWRNSGAANLQTDPNSTNFVLAPSNHDGFTNPDIRFIKNNTNGQDAVSYPSFGTTLLPTDVTPEFYVNFQCANVPTLETQKTVQIPIQLHVENLQNAQMTFSFWAMCASKMTIYLYQFLGTGVSSPAPIIQGQGAITLTPTWTQYFVPIAFPVLGSQTLSSAGDDAFYLQIELPHNAEFNISFCKPSLYLGAQVPGAEFTSYDQIDAVIGTPRTGDVRTSMNTFQPFGWVPLNNGTIGNASSNATARKNIDTWQLFSFLWTAFNAYTSGSTNLLAQMVTSAGSNVAYGGSAYADFKANNAITLSKTMGQVLLGTAPVSKLLTSYSTTFTATSNVLTAANNVNFFNGMPVYFTGTSTLALNTIYYVSGFNGTTAFSVSTTFANAMAGTVVTVASDSGTVVSALAGTNEGEYAHTQLVAELATHNHSLALQGAGASIPIVNQAATTAASGLNASVIQNNGSSTPFNVTQPGTFFNMYMKL